MRIERVSNTVSLKRNIESGTEEQQKVVLSIISDVRENGDSALTFYTEKFDGVTLNDFKVGIAEIKEAYAKIDESLIQTIHEAANNIRDFHSRQVKQSWIDLKNDGTILGQKITPLDAVGVYVPGGKAAYPSSVLMNVIPAQVAGVERIVMVTPPDRDGKIPAGVLVAADAVGVDEIYKVGGAQAIAALAYGTETIKGVDKIVGPGNIYVALAKREVFGHVAIDMIAGPSEIVVLADDTAYANEIAADLLSQAEHDERAASILVTHSIRLAEEVSQEVDRQLQLLPRREIAEASISEFGFIYVSKDIEESVRVVNELAPEHLEILTQEPMELVGKIKHAGAIFVGRYSTEPVGDYFAGPNHVLPTNGTARFSSPLNVDDFTKKSSIISYSKQALLDNGAKIAEFARLEGLDAHAIAIEERLKSM
ncbi:histidinol dehydrogenase [Fredinandcohnia quinoae]|uniref:Histidinol dehydrogenase n=1 Tax=Fredinandcohnia quinoae TaxID=2918902 RepID=A0AAW5E714_9BACI|nr:histidinol dehydrogenase [Fredinandcohnia sp. SECRCQ15]MCH1625791.1 histidinol dehydrogenase [Fredinandcohnia sp. SECRCQ15]